MYTPPKITQLNHRYGTKVHKFDVRKASNEDLKRVARIAHTLRLFGSPEPSFGDVSQYLRAFDVRGSCGVRVSWRAIVVTRAFEEALARGLVTPDQVPRRRPKLDFTSYQPRLEDQTVMHARIAACRWPKGFGDRRYRLTKKPRDLHGAVIKRMSPDRKRIGQALHIVIRYIEPKPSYRQLLRIVQDLPIHHPSGSWDREKLEYIVRHFYRERGEPTPMMKRGQLEENAHISEIRRPRLLAELAALGFNDDTDLPGKDPARDDQGHQDQAADVRDQPPGAGDQADPGKRQPNRHRRRAGGNPVPS